MPAATRAPAFVALALAAALAACSREDVGLLALATTLRQQYPGARIDIRSHSSCDGRRTLILTVDDSLTRTQPDSVLATRGRLMARAAVQTLGPGASDSIAVMLVRERERRGFLLRSESYSGYYVRFATRDLR